MVTTASDIPKRIAFLLCAGGTFWAFVLLLPTVACILGGFSEIYRGLWIPAAYSLCGYAIWAGWRWRCLELRPLRKSALLWSGSLIVNAGALAYVVYDIPRSMERWTEILFRDSIAFGIWWWFFATALSLAGFILEFRVRRVTVARQEPSYG